jgi:hypothetical protein
MLRVESQRDGVALRATLLNRPAGPKGTALFASMAYERLIPLAAVLLAISGCGRLFEDNGTHLAYALEKGAAQLEASSDHELVISYETLDGDTDPYYIEITPSYMSGQTSGAPGSYIVVSGRTRGGTSYHNRFIRVPDRLYAAKTHGGPTELVLRKQPDGQISVVGLR